MNFNWRFKKKRPPVAGLPQRKIDDFVNRPRKNFDRYKNLSDEKLEELKRKLPVTPPIWKRLHRDQKVCFLIGARQPHFAFFNDPSTGKTLLSLALACYFQKLGKLRRVLVLVPNLSNKIEWQREINKHCRSIGCCVLEGSSQEKWKQLEASDALITVETYAGLTRMVSAPVRKRGKNKLKPNRDEVKYLASTFGGLVMDESTEVKGYDSLIFRICRKLTQTVYMSLVLSGTPHGRDVTDLWSQMYLVDRGETLGETLGLFRAAFFTAKPLHFGGTEYTFMAKKRRLLHQLLANRSIRFKIAEADLPKCSKIPRYVRLSDEVRDWYDRATEALHNADGDQLVIKNTFLRMRQLSSGFVGLPGDEDGVRAKIVFDENPKLETLGEICRSIPEHYPIVVFHEFVYSGERINEELTRLGISNVGLRGGTADVAGTIKKFVNRDKQVLVLNHKAGGFGLNLQHAAYEIFYESPVSSIMRRQAELRVRRRYSDWHRMVIYDLLALDTVDADILKWHEKGGDLFRAIMDGEYSLD